MDGAIFSQSPPSLCPSLVSFLHGLLFPQLPLKAQCFQGLPWALPSSLRVSPTSVAETPAMCYCWGKWLPAQPPLRRPWSVVISIWMAQRMTLRWPSVAFPISLLSPQTSCSPVLSHWTWLRNYLRLLSLPHSLVFLDIQGLWIYIFFLPHCPPQPSQRAWIYPLTSTPTFASPALTSTAFPDLTYTSYCASIPQISAAPPSPKHRSTFLAAALQIPVFWPLPVCPTWCLSSSLAFT